MVGPNLLGRRERSYRVTERLAVLAKVLAILVAGLFAVAGCVRLDDWGKGYFSRTLKLLSLVAFAGAVLLVWRFGR